MLKKAREKLPAKQEEVTRFEIPKVLGHIQGNRTVVSNFYQICDTLQRKPQHLLKFLQKELATPGELSKSALIFGTKVSASRINEKIELYVDKFVYCKTCGKPDTKLEIENQIAMLKCMACGSKKLAK